MLLRWVGVALVFKQRESADEFRSGLGGFDHFINEATLGGDSIQQSSPIRAAGPADVEDFRLGSVCGADPSSDEKQRQ